MPNAGARQLSLFVSRRDEPNGDIYEAKRLAGQGFSRVTRLPEGINSSAEEWSPSVFENDEGQTVLYFSSTRDGWQDIFESVGFGAPTKVASLSTGFSDARPNVRHDGREIVFDSDRPGGLGASDIWTASRSSTSSAWGNVAPVTQVNSAAGESRASISWDGTMLVFGSSREGGEGGSDVYVSERSKVRGPKTIDSREEASFGPCSARGSDRGCARKPTLSLASNDLALDDRNVGG